MGLNINSLQQHTSELKHLITALKNSVVAFQWPNGIIPYVISESYNSDERAILLLAMKEFETKSCVSWVPRENSNPDHDHYVHIFKGQGCHSPVGRQQAAGGQPLSLGGNTKHFLAATDAKFVEPIILARLVVVPCSKVL